MNTIRTYNMNTIEGKRLAKQAKAANFSQKATAMATAYSAMKLRGIDSGITEMNSSLRASIGVQEDIRACVAANAAQNVAQTAQLKSMDAKLKAAADTAQKQYLMQQRDSEENRQRQLAEDREKELRKLEEKELQNLKNTLFLVSEEANLIFESDLTTLERYYTLEKLLEYTGMINHEAFTEFSDKKFLSDTTKQIKENIKILKGSFTSLDKKDFDTIQDIESFDEDKAAEGFLKKVTAEMYTLKMGEQLLVDVLKLVEPILSKFKNPSLDESREIKAELKKIAKEINSFRKAVKL
jgi:hypothetical protein